MHSSSWRLWEQIPIFNYVGNVLIKKVNFHFPEGTVLVKIKEPFDLWSYSLGGTFTEEDVIKEADNMLSPEKLGEYFQEKLNKLTQKDKGKIANIIKLSRDGSAPDYQSMFQGKMLQESNSVQNGENSDASITLFEAINILKQFGYFI